MTVSFLSSMALWITVMNSDDKVPRPRFDDFVKEPNQWERQLGWFWFKGRKIPFNPLIRFVVIPMQSVRNYDREENKNEEPKRKGIKPW
jgi:hypothetical protein